MSEEIRITCGAAVTVHTRRGTKQHSCRIHYTVLPHFFPVFRLPFFHLPCTDEVESWPFLNSSHFALFRGAPAIIMSVQILLDAPVVVFFFSACTATQQSHARAKSASLHCAFRSDTRARYSPRGRRGGAWWKEKAVVVFVGGGFFALYLVLNVEDAPGGSRKGRDEEKKGKQPEIEESEIGLKLILKKKKKKENESECARRHLQMWKAKIKRQRG